MKENGFPLKKKWQEADDIPYKLLLIQTKQMVLQIHQLKPNLCCVAWSRQQETLVPMWTQIKQFMCFN